MASRIKDYLELSKLQAAIILGGMYSSIYTKILHLMCLDNDVENGSQAIWVIFLVVELASFPNSETSPDAFLL